MKHVMQFGGHVYYGYTILIERNRREQRVLKNKQKTKLHDLDKL